MRFLSITHDSASARYAWRLAPLPRAEIGDESDPLVEVEAGHYVRRPA